MNHHPLPLRISLALLLLVLFRPFLHAGNLDGTVPAGASTRYGFLELLDHRSIYGKGFFPEPFLVDDSEGESGELRLDWLHTSTMGAHADAFRTELEYGIGLLTLELEAHYERDIADGRRTSGIGSIDLGARHPIFQYASPGGLIDSTFGIGFELGIPMDSHLNKNYEFVPKLFNDVRIGSHFSVQSLVGYSVLSGGEYEGGIQTLEYGFTFGYQITRKELPIPGVRSLIPVFEIRGSKQLNQAEAGVNSVLANAAVRFNLASIGPVQPRLGVGFVFPLNVEARADVHSGVFTSLIFDF